MASFRTKTAADDDSLAIDALIATATLNLASPTAADPNNRDGYAPPGSISLAAFNAPGNGTKNESNSIFGNGGANIVKALGGDDHIYGWAGNDVLMGGSGADIIYGGSGNDELTGGSEDDRLFGGDGADRLFGERHNDELIGGYGADQLTGGHGADLFIFNSVFDFGTNQACDFITDFQSGVDKIDLRDFRLAGGSNFDFAAFSTSGGAAYSLWQVGSRIYGDTDGDASTAELAIDVQAGVALVAGDFLL